MFNIAEREGVLTGIFPWAYKALRRSITLTIISAMSNDFSKSGKQAKKASGKDGGVYSRKEMWDNAQDELDFQNVEHRKNKSNRTSIDDHMDSYRGEHASKRAGHRAVSHFLPPRLAQLVSEYLPEQQEWYDDGYYLTPTDFAQGSLGRNRRARPIKPHEAGYTEWANRWKRDALLKLWDKSRPRSELKETMSFGDLPVDVVNNITDFIPARALGTMQAAAGDDVGDVPVGSGVGGRGKSVKQRLARLRRVLKKDLKRVSGGSLEAGFPYLSGPAIPRPADGFSFASLAPGPGDPRASPAPRLAAGSAAFPYLSGPAIRRPADGFSFATLAPRPRKRKLHV